MKKAKVRESADLLPVEGDAIPSQVSRLLRTRAEALADAKPAESPRLDEQRAEKLRSQFLD